MSQESLRPLGLPLLLSVALMACGRQASSPAAGAPDPVQLEAEAGTLSPLAPQDVAEPRTGGKVIRDQDASGGQAVILLGSGDAVRFRLPGNFTPGRYTVSVQGRGEFNQGWPTVALEDDGRSRLSVTTLDSTSHALGDFGEFDLRPNQELSVAFLNDRSDGPGRDRNAVVDCLVLEPVGGRSTEYSIQFGSAGSELTQDVAVDTRNRAFVVGLTFGTLPGQTEAGLGDAFVRKTDARGREVWTRQFGSPLRDAAVGVTVDAAGNSYVVGWTYGALPGQTWRGEDDAFVRKYDAAGAEVWTRQFGTAGRDGLNAVSVDAGGNVYVGGFTQLAPPQGDLTALVRKYTAGGDEVWTRTFAASGASEVKGVGVDAGGNVYLAGEVSGAFPGSTSAGGRDAFVARVTPGGLPVWTRQFGTVGDSPTSYPQDIDFATSLRVDAGGNVYVAGYVSGPLPGQTSAGLSDAFLRKYSPGGAELWTRQSGTAEFDTGEVDLDRAGKAYLTRTSPSPQGAAVVSVLRFTPRGTLVQTTPLGLEALPITVQAVAVGRARSVFVVGDASGAFLGTTNAGNLDAFLLRRRF